MSLRSLYQTLEDRSNIDEIENNGPFIFKNKKAWLGVGFYFWDSSIESAHWWGKSSCNNNYIICESKYNYLSEDYLDLVGNTEHMDLIKKSAVILNKKSNFLLTVPMIVEILKRTTDFLEKYKAIRAYPIKSRNNSEDFIFFNDNHKAYINLDPPIQICVLDKSFLYNNKFEIIYPEIYCKDFSV